MSHPSSQTPPAEIDAPPRMRGRTPIAPDDNARARFEKLLAQLPAPTPAAAPMVTIVAPSAPACMTMAMPRGPSATQNEAHSKSPHSRCPSA